jgi:lipoprotein-anchoring transpeptidase ErfK/SrfK
MKIRIASPKSLHTLAGLSVAVVAMAMLVPATGAPAGAAGTTKSASKSASPTTKPASSGAAPSTAAVASTKTTTEKGSLVAASKSGKKGSTITVYKAADGKVVQTKVKNPLSSRAVFGVIEETADYYLVNLPTRPNGSRGWIKKTDVSTYRTPFRVVISLTEKRLAVYEGDQLIIAANVAIGKAATPTPTGEFYVYWLRATTAKQKTGWGDFVFGLSGFGNNTNYGEGRIGIHGTDNAALIGTPASAGCVRVSNEVIRQMRKTLFLGTPVTIVA